MTVVRRFLSGGAVAIAVAAAGRQRRALSRDGAVASVVVGTLTVGGGGWWRGTVLVGFFTSSSALSLRRGGSPVRDPTARGAERDAVQVFANGGLAAALAAVAIVAPPRAQTILYAGFAGAVAAAAADTWATEIGGDSASPPRLIVGGRRVPPGTSGGVTSRGAAASVAGAGFVAALAALGTVVGRAPGKWSSLLAGTTVAGITGSAGDSVLGATVQAAYRCPRCDAPTERRVHGCGTPTRLVRGHPAVTNDAVNAAATLLGASVGATVAAAASTGRAA